MAAEIDEAWIESAIDRHRQVEALQEQFDSAASAARVSVWSADNSVELVVSATGAVVDVRIRGSATRRSNTELAQAVKEAVAAAADAATWAREKLHGEVFGAYRPLGTR